MPRRHVGDRQAGSLDERHRLGYWVAPCCRCRHELGEATGTCGPDGAEALAVGLEPGGAPCTHTTGAHGIDEHPIADRRPLGADAGTTGHDDAGDVHTGHVGQREAAHERRGALQEVEPVEPAGAHLDHDLVGVRHGIGEIFDGHHLGAAEATLHLCSHGADPGRTCCVVPDPTRQVRRAR